MCSLKENKYIFKNYMLIETKKVFILFLKIAREGLLSTVIYSTHWELHIEKIFLHTS